MTVAFEDAHLGKGSPYMRLGAGASSLPSGWYRNARSEKSPPRKVPAGYNYAQYEQTGGRIVHVKPKASRAEDTEDASDSPHKTTQRTKKSRKSKEGPNFLDDVETTKNIYRARRVVPAGPITPPSRPPRLLPSEPAEPRKAGLVTRLLRNVPLFSAPDLKHYRETYDMRGAEEAVKALYLTRRQLQTLHYKFKDIDTMGVGQISQSDFWDALDVVRSPFTDKLFEMIDANGSGFLDFGEFICVLVTYCVFSRDDILHFAFDAFDLDASGSIQEDELDSLITMLNCADPKFTKNIKLAKEYILADEDGLIIFSEFKELYLKFPLILQPAFDLQDKFHAHTLGRKAWVRIMENITNREKEIAIEQAQFGTPLRKSLLHKAFITFGLARAFAPVDVNYINSIRPSKIREALENAKDDDTDDEESPRALVGSRGEIPTSRSGASELALVTQRSARLERSSTTSSRREDGSETNRGVGGGNGNLEIGASSSTPLSIVKKGGKQKGGR
eukprot:CAMPEP_0172593082 /NCGR_PEP_ID=MMETSP1068-20121228/12275_1 /TAXON_ID=35684 /ORGANISM="Pseudopedinella elastica, Strain CCMP716" /LENGTH=502 /DNA_ID=CAMNT_0013390463 /DNA_START=157 /DNA_END=1665 /DNA_ORIENTATION=+